MTLKLIIRDIPKKNELLSNFESSLYFSNSQSSVDYNKFTMRLTMNLDIRQEKKAQLESLFNSPN